MSQRIQTIVRCILTIALLCVIWRHGHWSVALGLTLSAISSEINSFQIERVRKAFIASNRTLNLLAEGIRSLSPLNPTGVGGTGGDFRKQDPPK